MPEYLSPGVYIEEFEIGPRPIEGVSTSTAGFLGPTLRGPLEPRLVTGFEHFKRIYGGFLDLSQSALPHAVDGFFTNGGQRCFIGRIAPDDAAATKANDPSGILSLEAVGPGVWGDRIAVKIEPGGLNTATQPRFKLTAMYWDVKPPADPPVDPTDRSKASDPNRREPTLLEVYDDLTADDTTIDFYEKRINPNSNLVRVARLPGAAGAPGNMTLQYLASLGGTAGADGSPLTADDYNGDVLAQELPDGTLAKSGLAGFEQVDEIAILCAPDHHKFSLNVANLLIDHCEKLKDRFAVLHSNPSQDTLANINSISVPRDTTFAAFYFPWIKIYDPRLNRDIKVPPSGHVAGIYAKTDIDRGVHKAPANVVVAGATGLEFQITKGEQDLLNPKGVNAIRAFRGRGIRVWGARTSSSNTLWKYINVRRLFLFIEESIEEGTQWVVFEPNDHRLWARVRQTISQFLTTQWRNGALMGAKVEEAFFVKCDRTTMTQDDIDNGRLICVIGIAPVKPAEFVIFRLTQFSGGSELAEI